MHILSPLGRGTYSVTRHEIIRRVRPPIDTFSGTKRPPRSETADRAKFFILPPALAARNTRNR
jgi:hypothetical protein